MATKDLINTGPIYTRLSTGEPYTPRNSSPLIPGDPINIKRYPGFDFAPYQENLPEGMSIEETQQFGGPEYAQGEFQSGWEQATKGIPRIAVKVASEVAKLPGYLVGAGVWGFGSGFDPKNISDMVDNEWIKAIDSAEQAVKDKALPVFKTYKEATGSFSEQVFNPAFWATEGADGVGFFLSMLVPGQALKALKLGESISSAIGNTAKLIKPGTKIASKIVSKAGTLAEIETTGANAAKYINGGLAATVNTLYESGAEAGEGYKNIVNQLSHDIDPYTGEDRGPKMNPDTGQRYTEDEIKMIAGTNAANIMKSNIGVLMASNLIMEQLLFSSFDNSLSLRNAVKGGIVKEGDKLSLKVARPTILNKFAKKAISFGEGIVSEGLYEEGAQAAVQDYFTKRATGEEPEPNNYAGVLGGIYNTYIDNFSNSIEAQKSMLLGAVLGSFAGVGGSISRDKALERQLFGSKESHPNKFQSFFGAKDKQATEGIVNLLNDNLTNRYNDILSLAEKDGENYKYNADGSIKFDYNKVAEYIQDKVKNKLTIDSMAVAHAAGQKEIYNYLKEINDFNYMLPFLTQEEGLEALNTHIEDLAKLDAERQIQFLGKDKAQSTEQIKEQLLEKANRYNKVIKRLNQHHVNANLYNDLKYSKENQPDAERFIARVLAGKQQSYFDQSFLPKEISRLQAENMGLNEELAAEKQQKDANNKYIEYYTRALEEANKKWNNLTDKKYLQKELDAFLAKEKEVKKFIKDVSENISKNANTEFPFTQEIYNATSLEDTYYDPESSRERSVVNQGTIQVTLKDKDGNDIVHTEVIDGVSQEADLKFKVDKMLKNGKLQVTRILPNGKPSTTIINADGTILINGKNTPFSYKILETGEQAKLHNENKAAQDAYVNLINSHEKLLSSTINRIAYIEDRIKILENRIEVSLKNIHNKSGKLKKFKVGSKNGKVIWMDALEMSVQLNRLREKVKLLSEKAEIYSKLIERLNAELEGLKNMDENNLTLVKEAVTLFNNTLDASYSTYMNTRDLIAAKEKYLRMLFSRFKGFHTAFFNTFDSSMTDLVNKIRTEKRESKLNDYKNKINNLLDKQLYNTSLLELQSDLLKAENSAIIFLKFQEEIKSIYNSIINSNLPTEEQDAKISELISDVKLAIEELFSPEDAALMTEAFDKQIAGIVDTIEITEKELQDLYRQKNESKDLYTDAKKNRNYHLQLSENIYKYYNKIFKNQLDREFDVDPEQKKITSSIEPETIKLLNGTEIDEDYIESFDGVPLHPFEGSGHDFLHSTGKYNENNSDEYFRWMGYVYTTKDFSADKTPAHIIKTFTYDQVLKLEDTNPIKQQIKFYDGVSEKTMAELAESGTNDIVLNDIKIVVVNSKNSSKPYLVSESGESTKDSKYIIFSQLPLPQYTRDSGYDVFTYTQKLNSIEKSLLLKGANPKDVSILAQKELDVLISKELKQYQEFRDNAKKENQFLKITTRNPGKRVDTDEWNEVSEVAFDYLNPSNFEVAKTDGNNNTTVRVYKTTIPARNGFLYLISQNTAKLVTPKTLDQTNEIDQVTDLVKWLMENPNEANWTSVEKFLKQITYFLYSTDPTSSNFGYRLFLTKPKKDGKSIPGVKSIIFGENEYTKEEFLSNPEAVDKFKEFLKTKYHNFDSKSIKADEDYIEYTIKKGVLTPVSHPKSKGGYRHYLFGGTSTKGLVNLNKADKDPVSYARNPQYLNSSLNFEEYGVNKNKPETSSTTVNEVMTDSKAQVSDFSVTDEKIGLSDIIKSESSKSVESIGALKSAEETPSAGSISSLDAITASSSLFFSDEAIEATWKNLSDEDKSSYNDFEDFKNSTRSVSRSARDDSNYALGDINKQKSWLNEKFPGLPVHIYNQLIDNKDWGQFRSDLSFGLSKLAEIGTEYHEGYHAVSLLFMSPLERESLYNELKSRLKDKLTNAQAEEILAEEFREFMLAVDNGGTYKFGENQKLQKTLFNKIFNWLKQFASEVFGIEIKDNLIEKFKEIQNTTYNLSDIKPDYIVEDNIDVASKFTVSNEAVNRKIYCK